MAAGEETPHSLGFGSLFNGDLLQEANGSKYQQQKLGDVPSSQPHHLNAVSLIALYLDVPLLYPLWLGGSRSYVLDHAPSVESSSFCYSSEHKHENNGIPSVFLKARRQQD
uniref:Uncharacterized protein n=1 Tax=Oryza barthii TaxID=65489 RepID=A0A0D3G4U7_9ORYZ